MENHVEGASFRGEYRFLSNFYDFKKHHNQTITYKGEEYSNLEVVYVAMKCKHKKDYDEIISLKENPALAKQKGKTVELRDDWNEIKLEIMEDILRLKFNIPEMKDLLLSTGNMKIIEWNVWGDTYWGKNVETRKGSNHLGKLIMKIRDELKPKNGLMKFLTKS